LIFYGFLLKNMETFFFLIVGAVLFISIVLFYSIAQQQQNLKSQQSQSNNKTKQKVTKPIKSALKHPQKDSDTIAVPVVAAEEPKAEVVVATHVPKVHKEQHVKQQKSPKKVHKNDEHDNELLVLAKKNQKVKPIEEIKEEDKKISAQEEEWRDAKKGQKAEVDGVKKKLADKEHELSNALKQIEELKKKHLTEIKTQLARTEKKKNESDAQYKAEIQKLSKQHVREHTSEVYQISHKPIGVLTNPWGISLLNNIETTRKDIQLTREDLDNRANIYEKRRHEYLQKYKVDYFSDTIATQ